MLVEQIYNFIEIITNNGESVLVHSLKGQSRSCSVLVAYMMRKFRWSLFKTLEFLSSRRPELEIRANFIHQLVLLENLLAKNNLGAKSSKWNEMSNENDQEELILRNTFVNSMMLNNQQPSAQNNQTKKTKTNKLCWADNNSNDIRKLQDIFHGASRNAYQNGYAITKSCLKGGGKV